MAAFQCPSDTSQTFQIPTAYQGGLLSSVTMTKGNYAVAWGNTNWGQNYSSVPAGATYLQSAFGHLGNISLATITDGTSNTIFMAEVIQAAINDVRGLMWDPIAGGSSFMTRYTPNGNQDYLNILSSNPGRRLHRVALLHQRSGSTTPLHQRRGRQYGVLWSTQPPFRWNQLVDGRRLREIHQKLDQQRDLDRDQFDQQR